MAELPYSRVTVALQAPDALLERWSEAFERSPLRMPHPGAGRQIAPLVAGIIDGLAQAMPSVRRDGTPAPGDLRPGSPDIRPLEQSVAFAGASMAATGTLGFDVAAAILTLRDVILADVDRAASVELYRLFEWLLVICQDSWGMARERVQTEKLRELIERDTPVFLLAPTITAVTLVGAPDGVALDAIFARLILLIARMGASATIVDAAGLENPARGEVLDALGRFLSHRKIAGKVHMLAAGLGEEAETAWRAVAQRSEATVAFEPQLYDALQRAHEHAGYRLVRS